MFIKENVNLNTKIRQHPLAIQNSNKSQSYKKNQVIVMIMIMIIMIIMMMIIIIIIIIIIPGVLKTGLAKQINSRAKLLFC